jgi:transposase
MKKRYRVELTESEREELRGMLKKAKVARRKQGHARILLKADESEGGPGWKDEEIAEAFEVGVSTVERLRQRCVEEGLQAALERRPTTRTYTRKLDGAAEARLIALACGPAPEGRRRWTLKLLGERLVALEVVDKVSVTTVRMTLKKMNSSLG